MKLTYMDSNKNNWFLVSWTLSNKCNYKCSYCPSFLHDGSSGWPNFDLVKSFIQNFNPIAKDVCYRISGGEPTYYKHFIDMARLVKERNQIFSFLTNGSKSVDYYKDISEYCEGIILSYHPEYAKVDHFINIANEVKCLTGINLMLVPGQVKELYQIAKTIYENTNAIIWPKVVLDKTSDSNYITNDPSDYTKEELGIINDWPFFRHLPDQKLHRGKILLDDIEINANELILKKLNRHKGWQCWGGLHGIAINHFGYIYRTDCEQNGPIGTIENYELPTNTMICNMDSCNCLNDIYLQKSNEIN